MNLRGKIKRAFNEDARASKYNKWSPDSQPTLFELSNFLRKSGYRLVEIIDYGENKNPELIIEPIKSGFLHPEITHDIKDDAFYINVKQYGPMIDSDVEGIIKGYQTAISVVKHLDKLDLKRLEIREEE